MAFSSVEGLLQAAGQVPLWRAVLEDDLRERGVDEARSWRQMAALWTAMKAPVAEYDPAARSRSGLTGGAGARLEGEGPGLCPPFLRQVIAAALKTGECNACMKRIVAAPTAGASGVLPAVLLPLQARDGLDDRRMVEALYVAAGFGQVIATRASISGAEGGCQAEVGSASGMAAAALVYVMGGTPGQMAHAPADTPAVTLQIPILTSSCTDYRSQTLCNRWFFSNHQLHNLQPPIHSANYQTVFLQCCVLRQV